MLAVGVERDDGRRAVLERVAEAGPERRALAGVRDLAQDGRAGRLGLGGRVVGRAVIDDDDRQEGPRGLDDGRDARPLLVARDQREDGLHPPEPYTVVTSRGRTARLAWSDYGPSERKAHVLFQ